MTKELNFKNLTVKYDGEKFSKSVIRQIRTIERIGMLVIFVAFFGVGTLNVTLWDLENHLLLSTLLGAISMGFVVFGGSYCLELICNKFSPRHYEFVTWLMRYKYDEIEIGWLNDRYVVNMYGQHGWIKRELGNFVDEDYMLKDNADKSKPLHIILDLTQGDIEIIVNNKE